MRLRIAVFASALVALSSIAAPSMAGSAPQHDRGLTIHAVPHKIIAGDAVLIYGRLASHAGGKVIRLYHRIAPGKRFSLISVTKTDQAGGYEFTRAVNVVETNRSWFVRGPGRMHSRTVHERVAALISLAASSNAATTRHPVTFSGHVTPNHIGGTVLLQAQKGSSDDWVTLKRGTVGPGSDYQIAFAWRTPGARDVRVVFTGDARNVRSASDPVAVVIQQTEVPSFTINTSDPIVTDDAPATISGTLYAPGSTSTPESHTVVALFGHAPRHGPYRELQATTTNSSGGYSFTVQSSTNQWYQVRTVAVPHRATAQLFQGVQDKVTMASSSSTSQVGGHVTFSGTVSPDKSGHVIYLQKLGRDSDWHTVEARVVRANSTFSFGWTFASAGTKTFRARITGGPANVGGASSPVAVDVVPAASATAPPS
ncbi:MAG: hypothetical protein M3016_01870 [Actinomycetota bacterium]|nr:hypothetical protein [Actinomycetota bacterium]